MTSGRIRFPGYFLLLAAVFGCSWAVAAVVMEWTAPREVKGAAQALPSGAAYDSATVIVREKLSAPAAEAIGGSHATWMVVLRGKDLLVCEDLGRQLRELRTSVRGVRDIIVWTDPDDVSEVRAFLEREHLRSVQLRSVELENLFEGRKRPVTPAVLFPRPDGSVIGIAHPKRFPNVRLRSFAQELPRLQDFTSEATPSAGSNM